MKAKFNKLLANFERDEGERQETGTELGSQVGTAYFNSQDNAANKRGIATLKQHNQKTRDTEDGIEHEQSLEMYEEGDDSDQENCSGLINLKIGMNVFGKNTEKPPKP